MGVKNGPFARIATIRSDGIFGAFATSDAIFVTRLALAVIVIFAVGTLLDAEGAVFGVFAGMARIGSGAVASQFTLRMALLAFFFRSLKKAKIRVTGGYALVIYRVGCKKKYGKIIINNGHCN